jgi:quinol monooxygenase YgiN
MYARSTDIRGNPQKLDDGIRYVADKVMPAVMQMDGCVGLSMLCDRSSGHCIVTTSWDDHEALRRSEEGVRGIRDKTAEILGGEPVVEEWEIALLHRAQESPEGACCRVNWADGDPGSSDLMVTTFRTQLLPSLEETAGFCSVSVLIDRTTGRSATAVVYAGRAAMEEGTDRGIVLRRELARQTGRRVSQIADFDVVLAHLRVPETV